jgi:protein-tyrosine phosphatase
MAKTYIDFHSHLIPGIDDGSVDPADSIEMARILATFGFGTVHCTPHLIKGGFDNPPDQVREGVARLRRVLDGAGVEMKLVAGTEHYFDEYLSQMLPGALTVNGSNYLLVEVPFRAGGDLIPAMVAHLRTQKLFPLFAHPERCSAFQPPFKDEGMLGAITSILGRRKEPEFEGSLIMQFKQSGCRFQGNIGSFAGVYGSEVKQRAVLFLKHGIYSCLGSDAHTSHGLGEILAGGLDLVCATVGEQAMRDLLEAKDFR